MRLLADDELARRAGELEWLLCDVDGVLTDGGLYYDDRGRQLVRFDVKDGMALKLAQRAGLKVGLLSSRASGAVKRRAKELALDAVLLGVPDKGAELERFVARRRTGQRKIAFIGDDLADLIAMGRCGLAFAPADAVPEIRAVAHRVLAAPGGRGAVREAIELVLRWRGEWEGVLAPFSFDRG